MRKENPLVTQLAMLGEALSGRDSGNTIVESEHTGQALLVNSAELPRDMRGDRHVFEAWGIEFGQADDDAMFLQAKLPPGWKKEYTDHAMWSKLVDDKGRERASIFYKAAFYDRSAYMSANRRYRIDTFKNTDYRTFAQAHVLLDGKKVVWKSERLRITPENEHGVMNRETYKYDVLPIRDQATKLAVAWLNENRPGWQSPLLYWD